MRCLPTIQRDGQSWQLPLSESTARLLLLRYFDRSNDLELVDRRDVERALLLDPALALWCLAHIPPSESPITLRALAIWALTEDLPNRVGAASLPIRRQCSDRYRKIARASLAAAVDHSGGRKRICKSPKATALFLFNAPKWYSPRRSEQARVDELPMPGAMRDAICRAAKKRRKSKELSKENRRKIHHTWQQRNADWSDMLALAIRNVGPDTMLESAKLEALRQLAYGASHEINNPLANISTRAQTLMRTTEDKALVKHLSAMNWQAFRAFEMIADLMFFANPPAPELSRVQIDEVVRDVVQQVRLAHPTGQAIEIHQDLGALAVEFDRAQLSMAVKAIVQNAFEALSGNGAIWISAVAGNSNGSMRTIRMTIRDNGPGLSPDARAHLFDPFFSGREAGRGLGFGLTKAWRILELHAGKLSCHCPTSGGTEFTIEFAPLGKRSSAAASGLDELDHRP